MLEVIYVCTHLLQPFLIEAAPKVTLRLWAWVRRTISGDLVRAWVRLTLAPVP